MQEKVQNWNFELQLDCKMLLRDFEFAICCFGFVIKFFQLFVCIWLIEQIIKALWLLSRIIRLSYLAVKFKIFLTLILVLRLTKLELNHSKLLQAQS